MKESGQMGELLAAGAGGSGEARGKRRTRLKRRGAAARGDEREVRVVVEYVDDWRQAGRRSAE
jgi:hypothetical protein